MTQHNLKMCPIISALQENLGIQYALATDGASDFWRLLCSNALNNLLKIPDQITRKRVIAKRLLYKCSNGCFYTEKESNNSQDKKNKTI